MIEKAYLEEITSSFVSSTIQNRTKKASIVDIYDDANYDIKCIVIIVKTDQQNPK